MARTKIYRQKGKKADEKEEKIQAAVRGLDSGLYRTSRAAAKDLGIPKQFTTIWRRSRKRTRERREAHRNQMLLTSAQDRVLKGWMVWLATTGNPMSRETMVPKVFELSGREPSKKWCERWLARNLDLKMGKPTGLDPKRAKAFNFTTVNAHFHLFSQVVDMAEIPIENTLNLDEIGMALGGGRNGNAQEFFFSEDDRTHYRLQSDDLELVTVLETVCADGTAPVKPCFVFQGKLFCSEWADNDEDILLATTDSGWTNDNICMEWFKRNFIPQARAHGDPSKPFLLLLDGHGSHVTTDMIEIALENKIIIFQLPPHTTHRLQPCDVGAFGPLKTWWYKGCQSYLAQNGTSLPARDVVSVYMVAREKAFKTETVKAAWRKAGIDVDDISGLPKSNPGVFKPSDFKTSVSSSTTLDLPAGYVPDTGFITDDDSDVSQDSSSDDESGDEDLDMDVVPTCQLFPIPNPYEADTDDDEDYMPPIRESLTVIVDEEEPIPDTDIDEISLASTDLARHLKNRVDIYRRKYERMKEVNQEIEERLDESEAQRKLGVLHIKDIQRQLNAKKKRKKDGNDRAVVVGSRVASTTELRDASQRQKEDREARRHEKDTREQQRQDIASHVRAFRAAGTANVSFEGTLSTLKILDLKNVAWCLGILEDGPKRELHARIRTHFDSHPHLRADQHFISFFHRGSKRPAPPDDPENSQPVNGSSWPSQQRQLSDITNTFYGYPNLIYPALRLPPNTPSQEHLGHPLTAHPTTRAGPSHNTTFTQYFPQQWPQLHVPGPLPTYPDF